MHQEVIHTSVDQKRSQRWGLSAFLRLLSEAGWTTGRSTAFAASYMEGSSVSETPPPLCTADRGPPTNRLADGPIRPTVGPAQLWTWRMVVLPGDRLTFLFGRGVLTKTGLPPGPFRGSSCGPCGIESVQVELLHAAECFVRQVFLSFLHWWHKSRFQSGPVVRDFVKARHAPRAQHPT